MLTNAFGGHPDTLATREDSPTRRRRRRRVRRDTLGARRGRPLRACKVVSIKIIRPSAPPKNMSMMIDDLYVFYAQNWKKLHIFWAAGEASTDMASHAIPRIKNKGLSSVASHNLGFCQCQISPRKAGSFRLVLWVVVMVGTNRTKSLTHHAGANSTSKANQARIGRLFFFSLSLSLTRTDWMGRRGRPKM